MLNIQFIVDNSKLEGYWIMKYGTKPSKDVFLETEKFRKTIEADWKAKESIVSLAFKEITGIDLQGEFTVFVFHPNLEISQYNNEKHIEWGYAEKYNNYITIGIAHELLHCLTHNFYITLPDKKKWFFHSIIYLSIDEELRRKLGGESDYFSSPIIQTYHKKLLQRAKEILPFWKEYIQKGKKKNILDFYRVVISKLISGT